MMVVSQSRAPTSLSQGGKNPGNHFIGDRVGPRAGLDGCGKSRPTPGFDPRIVWLVASRCTDYAVRTHSLPT